VITRVFKRFVDTLCDDRSKYSRGSMLLNLRLVLLSNQSTRSERPFLSRRPFIPIRIHLTDETIYDIRHPEMAFLTRSTVEVGIEKQEGSGIADDVV